MGIFQKILGESSISTELTPYPDRSASGMAFNDISIQKSWLTLWRSDEQYTLHPDGHRVRVDAQVNFGPISFLFREHDVYPATVIDGDAQPVSHQAARRSFPRRLPRPAKPPAGAVDAR